MALTEIDCTQVGAATVIRLGPLCLGSWDADSPPTAATESLTIQMWKVVAETNDDLILDLRAVLAMRTFLSPLLSIHKALNAQNRRLILCLGSELREVFQVTKLDRIIPCTIELEDALAVSARTKVV